MAYQVSGVEGSADLVYLQGFTSHVDLNWESPSLARFLRGLGQVARVIHTDRRGWGCSDRFTPGDVAPLEVQVGARIGARPRRPRRWSPRPSRT